MTEPGPRFEQFFAMRRLQSLSNLAFSPDGETIAYSTDASGQFNLWTQPAPGGWPSGPRTCPPARS